jgi:hypothetical protein
MPAFSSATSAGAVSPSLLMVTSTISAPFLRFFFRGSEMQCLAAALSTPAAIP